MGAAVSQPRRRVELIVTNYRERERAEEEDGSLVQHTSPNLTKAFSKTAARELAEEERRRFGNRIVVEYTRRIDEAIGWTLAELGNRLSTGQVIKLPNSTHSLSPQSSSRSSA